MALPAAQSPGIRLHISIKDKQTNDFTEILRGTCKGYEVVEVDGLVFRRKRRATPISSGTSSKAKLVDSEDKVNTGPFQGISEKEAATMPAFALRADDKGSTVMEESLPGSHETSGNTALEETSGPPECSAATLAQNALEKLAESDSEAHRLQALCVNIPKEGLEGCQEVIGLLDLSIAKALKEGSLMCHKPLPHDSLPARLEAEKQQKLASLHSQITALKQEEAEWLALLEQGNSLSKRNLTISTVDSDDQTGRVEVAPVLKQLQRQSHAVLSFQVEGLATMIGNVEHLLGKAENQCRLMQVEYHKEKFLKFPHIDSPARLIHEIVKDRRY